MNLKEIQELITDGSINELEHKDLRKIIVDLLQGNEALRGALADACAIRSTLGFMLMRMAVVKDKQDAYNVAQHEFDAIRPALERFDAFTNARGIEYEDLLTAGTERASATPPLAGPVDPADAEVERIVETARVLMRLLWKHPLWESEWLALDAAINDWAEARSRRQRAASPEPQARPSVADHEALRALDRMLRAYTGQHTNGRADAIEKREAVAQARAALSGDLGGTQKLISDAAKAVEEIDPDELEEHAKKMRDKNA